MKEVKTLIGCKQSNQDATRSCLDKGWSGAGVRNEIC